MAKSKNFLIFLAAALPMLFGCCCDCPVQPKPEHALLVFIDKSESVHLDSLVNKEKIKSLITMAIDTMLRFPGDKIEVRFVHGQTAGATIVLNEFVQDTVPCECDKTPQEIQDEHDAYESNIEDFKTDLVKDIVSSLEQSTANSNISGNTDLLGTLQVASEFLSKAPDFKSKVVIYLSDMVHSVQSDGAQQRDYHANPLKDKVMAENAAKTDLAWAKSQYTLQPGAWDNTKVLLWFPSTSMDQTHNEQMKNYWKTLFAELNGSVKVLTN